MSLFDPELIERCRLCGRPVGTWHDEWCKWYDNEPEHPDEWVEVDPEAIDRAEDSYHHSMIGERW